MAKDAGKGTVRDGPPCVHRLCDLSPTIVVRQVTVGCEFDGQNSVRIVLRFDD